MAVTMSGGEPTESGKPAEPPAATLQPEAAGSPAAIPDSVPEAADPVACSVSARRFFLRLDNGDLICDGSRAGLSGREAGGVVLLGAERLETLGRIKHADLLRAHRILDALRRASHAEAGPPIDPRPPKKTKTDVPAPLSPSGTVLSGGAVQPPSDWLARCTNLLESVKSNLGNALPIFNAPVDGSVVLDYYKVIKNPMDLGTIAIKLEDGIYTRPSEFAADVRQVWYNCKLYNKKGDYVERTGSSAALHFEKIWAGSGLAESKDRMRRANAGLAADKFEPPEVTVSKKQPGHKGVGKATSRLQGPARTPKGSKINKAFGKKSSPQMTREQMAALAERLGQLDEGALQGVVGIIRERTQLSSGDPEEEIELDIETLDNETLWQLDRYLKSIDGAGPLASGAAWAGQGGGDSGSDTDSST
eukprot:scaffold667923_cov36-Prasinocladus_malaysianus.AAC.2